MKIDVDSWVINEIFPEYKDVNITKLPRKKKKKAKKYIAKSLIDIAMNYVKNLNI
jgi:hypothetical protein